MSTNFEKVQEFHAAIGKPLPVKPTLPEFREGGIFRMKLIDEESNELRHALYDDNMVEVADAIADLLYVVYGTAVEFGLPIDKIFAEVHRSNMTKFKHGAHFREDGKLLKGPGFEPPKIKEILENI